MHTKYVLSLVKCYIQDNLCSSSIYTKHVLNVVRCYIHNNLCCSSIYTKYVLNIVKHYIQDSLCSSSIPIEEAKTKLTISFFKLCIKKAKRKNKVCFLSRCASFLHIQRHKNGLF